MNRTTRKTAARQARPAHECDWHVGGVTFGINLGADGTPEVIGQLNVCCGCGRSRMQYLGVVEEGHGPYVHYVPTPTIAVARELPKIAMPNGAH